MPEVERYEKRNISTEEAGMINRREAERIAKAADEANSHPAQETMGKITNLKQLNPQKLEEFINYSKSQAALHDFFAGQTGLQTEKRISQAEFVKTLKKIELVDFKGDRELMIKHWITHPDIRTDFDKFFNMFRDRAFQGIAKRYSVPDHPPRHYFENENDCPTPLYNLETGLVEPDYLAYLCCQVIDDDAEMLKPQYNLELTHLALVLYIYGQNCVSLQPYRTIQRRCIHGKSHLGKYSRDCIIPTKDVDGY